MQEEEKIKEDWKRMKGEKEEDERWWEGRSEDTRRKKGGHEKDKVVEGG